MRAELSCLGSHKGSPFFLILIEERIFRMPKWKVVLVTDWWHPGCTAKHLPLIPTGCGLQWDNSIVPEEKSICYFFWAITKKGRLEFVCCNTTVGWKYLKNFAHWMKPRKCVSLSASFNSQKWTCKTKHFGSQYITEKTEMRDTCAWALAKGKSDVKCNKFETPGTYNCSEIPL